MLTELSKTKRKVVGKKQTVEAIKNGKAVTVFLAVDSDKHIKEEIDKLCQKNNVSIVKVESKLKLGRACGIDVSAACAALMR